MRLPISARLAAALPLLTALGCPVAPRVHPRAAEQVSRGYRYLSAADAERAEIAFRHSLAFDPDFPEGENGLGLVARTRGDLAAARRSFERAISLRPDFAEAHANLGELLLAEGDGEEAEDRLRMALRIDPDLADARQNLTRLLLWRGLEPGEDRTACLGAARREALHLLEAAPDRAAAHHDLGLIAYLEADFTTAEASYRRAAELDPGSAEALHGLCLSLVRQGRCDEAVAACARCLDLAGGAGTPAGPPLPRDAAPRQSRAPLPGPAGEPGQPVPAAPSLASQVALDACRRSLRGARACAGTPDAEAPAPGISPDAGAGP